MKITLIIFIIQLKSKKIIYVENVFEDERFERERDLARNEHYTGRVVFPLIYNKKVVDLWLAFKWRRYFKDEDMIAFQ